MFGCSRSVTVDNQLGRPVILRRCVGKTCERETNLQPSSTKRIGASSYASRRSCTVEAPVIRLLVDRVEEGFFCPENMMLNRRIIIRMDEGVITLWGVKRRLSDLFTAWLRGFKCFGLEYNEMPPEMIGRSKLPPVEDAKRVSRSPLSSLSAFPAPCASPASPSDELFYSASSSPLLVMALSS